MTRDFAKKSRPAPRRRKAQSQVPGWVWLFTGTVLGAFITFLVYLADLPESPGASAEAGTPVAQRDPEPESRPISKPRFDFYKLLKESEVIVPATEPEPEQREPELQRQAAEPRLQDREEFILQVGSFRRTDEADRLRAQLLLLNLEAYTEQVTLNNDQVWHRVLVGPFNNQSRLASARATLVSNEYNALVLKRQAEH
jgi:cell division protein FtsN